MLVPVVQDWLFITIACCDKDPATTRTLFSLCSIFYLVPIYVGLLIWIFTVIGDEEVETARKENKEVQRLWVATLVMSILYMIPFGTV